MMVAPLHNAPSTPASTGAALALVLAFKARSSSPTKLETQGCSVWVASPHNDSVPW